MGPNGCGKSNIIDAVRWVMGESSAKNLRGESMTDVIFNGSGGRKPVGQASIELVFDNSDATLVGEYAGFSEISIRRKVTRDAQNTYYLNGTKCRRRDITDIFLGTGLGPRSYAIIEQGMISRLIEAKPEELRVYIEEAAGISKYKERRRDTENRMRRTMENLERLTDIRDELERQLSRLQRQAQAAEKYTEYKKDERQLKANLQAHRLRVLSEQNAAQREHITGVELEVEALVTRQVEKDTAIEKYRSQYTELGDAFNEVQGRFYSLGADIARIEQTIQHAKERGRQLETDLEQTERDYQQAQEHLSSDSEKVEQWEAELLEIEPELEMMQAAEDDSSGILQEAEDAMQAWQTDWDGFNQSAARPRQQAEVEQSRIQHLEQVLTRLNERIRKLTDEQRELVPQGSDEEAQLLQEQLAELELLLEEQRLKVESYNDELEQKRVQENEVSNDLDRLRGQLQTQRGRFASLEALQQAALGEADAAVVSWLQNRDLSAASRLAESLVVTDGWDTAVEVVLGNSVQGVEVEALNAYVDQLAEITQGELVLIEKQTQDGSVAKAARPTLNQYVSGAGAFAEQLGQVYCADDLSTALSWRSSLGSGESIITQDGIWIGAGWAKVIRPSDATAGVIARKQEIESLQQSLEETERQVSQAESSLQQSREAIRQLEQDREAARRALDGDSRRYSDMKASRSALEAKMEQHAVRHNQLRGDIEEVREQISLESESLAESRLTLQTAIEAMEADTEQRESLLARRDDIRARLDSARQRARHDRDRGHELAMRYQNLKTQMDSMRLALVRTQEQTQRLSDRRAQLQASLQEAVNPGDEHQLELEALLEKRLTVEQQLSEARANVEQVEHDLKDSEKQRNLIEQELQATRAKLEQSRLQAQTLEVQKNSLAQQLEADGFNVTVLLADLPEDADHAEMQQALDALASKITRLGPINLAAIDEYKTESERKNYLDRQNDDLNEALETLENAIKRIDRETRTRFKETFDQVNGGLQDLFPKVFGGGHAYLELTGDDMLDTGIAIMARPPGKRNSTIHLLSGGEKALTAIALVFSIFRLNPAPFCMLDEVDAPLDDANVGRYARMVEEMSQQVQFIYITHNKIAMEMAHQLLGVTMHEPGVSRLVTVDVDEAAELAAS